MNANTIGGKMRISFTYNAVLKGIQEKDYILTSLETLEQ